MALVAQLRDENSLSAYCEQVETLMFWIEESSLELNISKTKELFCVGRRTSDSSHPFFEFLRLNGQAVEQVGAFRYLGTEIAFCLSPNTLTPVLLEETQKLSCHEGHFNSCVQITY